MRIRASLAVAASCLTFVPCAGQVALVGGSASEFAIVHAPDAPPSVVQAAGELQAYLLRATGAELPIVTEPRAPAVILGAAAGIDTAAIPLEGFRIATVEGNVLIAGPDTADGESTPMGGTSAGTRNGVYAFLERFAGVRWLMPGEHGDFVPQTDALTIPAIDWQDAPFFLNRRLPYTHERTAATKLWWDRQRLGWSLALYHGHNWKAVPPEEFATHPEWFAEHGGARMPPTGEYKLCITNPEVVQFFAGKAMERFAAGGTVYSLSPSDGRGWCECANCRALYFEVPEALPTRQVTPAILQFYNAVANIVGERYPDRLLAGYVYQDYVYPPPEPITLEPNVFLVWAPTFDYGFTLFRPDIRALWEELGPQWAAATGNIAYYDLPNCVHNSMGAPNPPGIKILKFLYPRLKQLGFKGVYVYGNQAWGHSALMNYLLAKLAWDPDADLDALTEDFLAACYAEGADEIGALYALLDDATERYYLAHPEETYSLREPRLREVYAGNFAEMERLYRAAEAQITDEGARVRLERLGLNLALLHGNLRQFGMLDNPQASSFYLDDAALRGLIEENRDSIYVYPMRAFEVPGAVQLRYAVEPVVIPNAREVTPFRLRGRQHLLLRPDGAGPVSLTMRRLNARGALPTVVFYDADAEEVKRDVLRPNEPVVLEPTGAEYYHAWIEAGSAFFGLEVTGAAWAVSDAQTDKGLHFLGDLTPMRFRVPEGLESFSLWLGAEPPGETAAGVLYAPDGREVARFDCTAKSIDEQRLPVGAGDAGWWVLVPTEPATGVVDDVYVRLGDELPGWFSLDPEHALVATPEE